MSQDSATPTVHTMPVVQTARYYTQGNTETAPSEIWFVLHGYGQLAEYFIRHFSPLAGENRLIIAPEAPHRFYARPYDRVGASWVTKDLRWETIGDEVVYLNALYENISTSLPNFDRSKVKLGVLGFSQGVSMACRWLKAGALKADRLICWGGDLPHELDRPEDWAFLAGVPVQMVVGADDEFINEERRAAVLRRLTSLKLSFETVLYEGGHRLVGPVLANLLA